MALRTPRIRTGTNSPLDAIARGLAGGMSRREALRMGGAALVGVAGLTPSAAWAATTGHCPQGHVKCGTKCCPTGEVCLPPARAGGAHHCGCAHHLTRCSGRCVNVHTNVNNCGACGHKCPTGQHCANGVCACPSGETKCSGQCVSLTNNPRHCGSCGHSCPQGQTCSQGKCQLHCASGETACSGSCVNLSNNAQHCGTCGNACPTGQVCQSGQCAPLQCPEGQTNCSGKCVNLSSDVNNCGACGSACSTYFAVSLVPERPVPHRLVLA